MASWNNLAEGSQIDSCPVCRNPVSKKKLVTHLANCTTIYKEYMEEHGIIKCPLYEYHIMPKKYLNHHLEYACDEAMNLLREYFQKPNYLDTVLPPPESFLASIPDDVLNKQNKRLLYNLKRDFHGNNIGNDTELYPPEEQMGYQEEANESAAEENNQPSTSN